MERAPTLQEFIDALESMIPGGVSDAVKEGNLHKPECTCDKCREWWKFVGPDPDTGEYGPFGKEI